MKDASLTCPPGIDGIVVGVRIFSRKGIEKDDRAKQIEQDELDLMEKNLQDEIRILHEETKKRLVQLLNGRTLRSDLFDDDGRERVLRKGARLRRRPWPRCRSPRWCAPRIETDDLGFEDELRTMEDRTAQRVDVIQREFEEKKEKIRRGDELPPGVIKLVKVYVAMKRKLSVGDKMAGRHGNKGVIARILPEEDMPYLPDGTPVEIVLNPLGVPSRMNVGQILETHLGWAAHALGLYFATPVFDGATEAEIKKWLEEAGLPKGGKTQLFDGMNGLPLRTERDGRLHLHAEAVAPGRRQDPRALDRAVLAHYAAAARRQGAVRRAAVRGDGRSGRSRRTAPRTSFRSCSRPSPTT